MTIERSHRGIAATRIAALARELLDASTLATIATVTPRGAAHINTAYFAWSADFDIVWLSEPRAGHSRNLRANTSAAIAVYDSTQTWGKPDRGIQLFGPARETAGDETHQARTLYTKRFPHFTDTDLGAYRFYRFQPHRLKLFDERTLGPATFVSAHVRAGKQLEWAQTEIYRSSS
jgi:uncharacterized protein YhbP (UPF0306 family)